ncbi:MAG TPA: hypothetical protein VER03_00850 [Bryobacteraceae bacterium]|nr:hypothetical protein [Bryobacteraceae bacterium]
MSSNPYGLNADLSKVRSKPPAKILDWKGGKWGPQGGFRYKVRFGDNWWKVAAKDGWSDPMDLVHYNFQTRNPKEVNWYLRNFVGCKYATQDGYNHIFSDHLTPGYIYTRHKLQEEPAPFPARVPWPDTPKDEVNITRPGVWVGVGAKAGAFAAAGYERTEALMFSADFTDVYSMSIDTLKFGGGAGAGWSGVLVVASGLPTLADLKYCVLNGMDWNLSVGLRMKGFATAASGLANIRYLIQAIRKGDAGLNAITNAAGSVKYIAGLTNSCNFGNMPTVTVIEIPLFGVGLEVSLYSGRSTFSVRTIRESDTTLLEDALTGAAG